jgi:F-type H+-transporting ATPase subunit g
MAARVQQLLGRARGLVEPTLGRGANEVAHRFEDLMQKNAEYVVKDPAQANKLLRQWTFTQLAR